MQGRCISASQIFIGFKFYFFFPSKKAHSPPDFILGSVKGGNNRLLLFEGIVFPILLLKFKLNKSNLPILFSSYLFLLLKKFAKI